LEVVGAVGVELARSHLVAQKVDDPRPEGVVVWGEVRLLVEAAEEHFVAVEI
jgi:hypothetical protein